MKKTLFAAVVLLTGTALANPVEPAQAGGSMNLNVASFNVQSVAVDRTSGEQRPWRERRDTVVSQILREGIDVVGLQEASASKYFADRLVNGTSQMTDLLNGLRASGRNYRLTNYAAFNCLNASTQYKCRYRYRAATGDNRIIYNADRLTQLKRGGLRYRHQGSNFVSYLPWALFETKATGDRFVFASTHLTTGAEQVRRAQWSELIAKMNKLRSTFSAPLFVVGDFNTHKFSSVAQTYLPRMRNNGYGDVTGQVPYTNRLDHPRARSYVNGWVNSYNHLERNVRTYSYWSDRSRSGNTIDWIFASNGLHVQQYELVLDFGSDLRVNGTLPSDHNMLRATVTLP